MANFLSSGAGGGVRSPGRQHPLLLWLDGVGYESSGPLSYWLSLAAYYLLLFACSWFVLQWFRRGRPWARARSFLSGKSKSEGDVSALGGGVGAGRGPPQLRYRGSEFNRRLLARTTVLRQPYVPSPWLGHRVSVTGSACLAHVRHGRGVHSCTSSPVAVLFVEIFFPEDTERTDCSFFFPARRRMVERTDQRTADRPPPVDVHDV